MKNRFVALILVFLLALASFAFLLDYSDRHDSITLADLTTPEQGAGGAAHIFRQPARLAFEGQAWLADLSVESFFYGVLGICGVLLALRAIISALNILREERVAKTRSKPPPKSLPVTRSIRTTSAAEDAEKYANPPAWKKAAEDEAAPRKPSALVILWNRWMPHHYGLTRRLALSFVGVVAAFGLFTIFLVQFTLTASLR